MAAKIEDATKTCKIQGSHWEVKINFNVVKYKFITDMRI